MEQGADGDTFVAQRGDARFARLMLVARRKRRGWIGIEVEVMCPSTLRVLPSCLDATIQNANNSTSAYVRKTPGDQQNMSDYT